MAYCNPVEFMRIYNPPLLKEMCANVIQDKCIRNVNRMLKMNFVEKFSASEMSYLTGSSKEKLISVLLYTLSMSSSTLPLFSSEVIGKLWCKQTG